MPPDVSRLSPSLRGLLFLFLSSLAVPSWAQDASRTRDVQLTIETGHPTAAFDPRHALGAGLDGHWQGEESWMLSPASVRQMLKAGLGPISVRLRTELAVDAWHWNPRGQWSDPQHHQGYWISAAEPQAGKPILISYGYRLPRRGNTEDEANNDGYSMLDDGDSTTFWKSNPYLTRRFTGEPDVRHPQWVVLDFGKAVPINAIRIQWGEPYATDFTVEYANGGQVYFGGHPSGVWKEFPRGRIAGGMGGNSLLPLTDRPVRAQYLRIWMTEGSGTAPAGSTDVRDRLGYATREISAGVCDPVGKFHDWVIHVPGKRQTNTYVSSTDPWHRAVDRDPHVEQPGVDRIFRSGVTRGRPIMQAVPVLYDIPENGAALAAYLRRAGYPVRRWELGEEPDGQRVSPRDFAALYAQTARAVRKQVPQAVFGGPSFVTGDVDYLGLTYHHWFGEFRRELAHLGQSDDLRFLSFEWYPFDDVLCPEDQQLPDATELLDSSLARLRREHLPIVLGEFNYSAYATEHEVDLGGALLNADIAAQFLCSGGDTAYYYGYEPDKLQQKNGSWGQQMMLMGKGGVPVATFHALGMLTNDWLDPQGGRHQSFRVANNLPRKERNLLSAFALRRPDQTWSLLLINKDASHALRLSLQGGPVAKEAVGGSASWELATYSSRQYLWRAAGPDGHPIRNDPPVRSMVRIDQPIPIPAWSVSGATIQARRLVCVISPRAREGPPFLSPAQRAGKIETTTCAPHRGAI